MKRTVGILSMQRVTNYGSFMQAYALKSIVEQLGNEVYFIDIENGIPVDIENIVKSKGCENQTKYSASRLFFLIRRRFYAIRTKKIFTKKLHTILELEKKFPGQFDLTIIGSDEVFNCTQKSEWGFSTQLFGTVQNALKIITYAGSFGYTSIDRIKKYNLEERIRKAMQNLEAVSVRDDNSSAIVSILTGKEPLIHLDPVLIYDFSKYTLNYKRKVSNYILIYAKQIKSVDEINEITSFAKSNNVKLISVGGYYEWCDKALIPESPDELLSYFQFADFVITDTYHGTIFSIITKRKFCTIVRNSNKQKLMHLLNFLGLNTRLKNDFNSIGEILKPIIDYNTVDELLMRERIRTIEYLREYLK